MSLIDLITGELSGDPSPDRWRGVSNDRADALAAAAGASLALLPREKFYYTADYRGGGDAVYPAAEDLLTMSRSSAAWDPEWSFISGDPVGPLTRFAEDRLREGRKGALLETASTNVIRNPRFEGADVGDNISIRDDNAFGGETEILGKGSDDGWPFIEIRWTAPAGGARTYVNFEAIGQIVAVPDQHWTLSLGAMLTQGAAPQNGMTLQVFERDGGSIVRSTSGSVGPVDYRHRRYFDTITTGEDTDNIFVRLTLELGDSQQLTLKIYAPQLEQQSWPSSPILPPEGSPGAATRAGDSLTLPDGPWFRSLRRGSMFIDFTDNRGPQAGESGGQYIALLRADSSAQVRFRLGNPGGDLAAQGASGGGTQFNLTNSGDPLAAGDRIRACVAWDVNESRLRSSRRDEPDSDLTVDMPNVGADLVLDQARNVYLRALRYWARRISDAEMDDLASDYDDLLETEA